MQKNEQFAELISKLTELNIKIAAELMKSSVKEINPEMLRELRENAQALSNLINHV